MMWVIASLPFWIVASCLFVLGGLAVTSPVILREAFIKDPKGIFFGGIAFIILASFFALIAAKVAS